jgi:hypothetical protein
MVSAPDMRIPVLFNQDAAAAAYLLEGDATAPKGAYAVRFTLPAAGFGHAIGCACCTPRGPAANALAELFRARATGAAPFFSQVVVVASPAGIAAIRAAIEQDVLANARFRITA